MSAHLVAASQRFQAFTGQHYLLLGIFAVGCVVVVLIGRRHRGRPSEVALRRWFAVVLLAFTVPLSIVFLLPGQWDLGASLPIQLCDLAWIAAAVALWTCWDWAIALTYFWGLTLSIQGIITPSLGQSFPDVRYFGFWGRHFFIVWAAVLLTAGLARAPGWRGYRFTVAATAIWAVLVIGFNFLAGTNYGYLNRKPPTASILDLMGPWPFYVGAEIGILLVVWALMTWPWEWARRRAGRRDALGHLHKS
jgi:hypothetical integral membrane protein (TIGR02206 family)